MGNPKYEIEHNDNGFGAYPGKEETTDIFGTHVIIVFIWCTFPKVVAKFQQMAGKYFVPLQARLLTVNMTMSCTLGPHVRVFFFG